MSHKENEWSDWVEMRQSRARTVEEWDEVDWSYLESQNWEPDGGYEVECLAAFLELRGTAEMLRERLNDALGVRRLVVFGTKGGLSTEATRDLSLALSEVGPRIEDLIPLAKRAEELLICFGWKVLTEEGMVNVENTTGGRQKGRFSQAVAETLDHLHNVTGLERKNTYAVREKIAERLQTHFSPRELDTSPSGLIQQHLGNHLYSDR
jgi:hypothetical protein